MTLNYENSNVMNFTSLRRMILEDDSPIHEHNPEKVKLKHGVVVSEPETKEYKVVFKKRWLMTNFDFFPYGYF
jgi:phenylacetate-coenzyme A ligase PaaK-like adenylate-forming protein